jgi:LacI family transcriptional regulator
MTEIRGFPLAANIEHPSQPAAFNGDTPIVTVTDVAREAGVSVSTVSRIVNGTARVADDKRQAVEAAIARMGYRPNLHARSLKMGTSMTIGMLTQDIESPFLARVIRGFEEALKGTGYAPIIVSGHWNQKEETERVGLLMARRIDGLVVLYGELSDAQLLEISRRQPVVATGRRLEGSNIKTLQLDHEQGGYIAASHLLSLGHRRIAHISGPSFHKDAIDRYAGFVRAHQEFGVEVDPGIVFQGDFLEHGGVLAMNRLLDCGKNFTAVFAANDQSAMGAHLVMHRRGIRVPEDVSLMGFDDIPATAYLTPPLTTVRQPFFEIGRYLAQSLLSMLGHDIGELVVPSMELVIRESVKRC